MTPLRPFLLLSLTSLALTGCGFLYKPDITQGNVYSSEQIAAISVGMPKEHVRQILGTPSIIDPFHPNIDIYAFSFTSGKENRTYQRHFNIHYTNDIVSSVNETPLTIQPK